jgi:tellurite resistance protein TerC
MIWLWTGFVAFVLAMLALDLGVFHRKAHVVSVKEAVAWSAFWISLGLLFAVFVYHGYENQWLGLGATMDAVDGVQNDGGSATLKYLTGYVVEKSLSIDNVFVIAMVFGFFAVPPLYQHRVLFWGILGALVLRGAMIAVGAKLIAEFHWVLYVFGVFLIVTAIKMLVLKTDSTDPNHNVVVRLVRRFLPVTARFHGEHFLVRAGTPASREAALPGERALPDPVVEGAKAGTLLLTPLALALVMVETTDLIFAVDSIPAIFAITADPFLVFTSNVFAILGLRSLYFALAGMLDKFRYLKVALAVVLMVVGIKMLIAKWLKSLLGEYFNVYLLALVLLILATGVLASLVPRRGRQAA